MGAWGGPNWPPRQSLRKWSFSQLTSKAKLEKVIIFRYTFSSLMGVLIDLQDTALESDHFLSLTGDPNWPFRCLDINFIWYIPYLYQISGFIYQYALEIYSGQRNRSHQLGGTLRLACVRSAAATSDRKTMEYKKSARLFRSNIGLTSCGHAQTLWTNSAAAKGFGSILLS